METKKEMNKEAKKKQKKCCMVGDQLHPRAEFIMESKSFSLAPGRMILSEKNKAGPGFQQERD